MYGKQIFIITLNLQSLSLMNIQVRTLKRYTWHIIGNLTRIGRWSYNHKKSFVFETGCFFRRFEFLVCNLDWFTSPSFTLHLLISSSFPVGSRITLCPVSVEMASRLVFSSIDWWWWFGVIVDVIDDPDWESKLGRSEIDGSLNHCKKMGGDSLGLRDCYTVQWF